MLLPALESALGRFAVADAPPQPLTSFTPIAPSARDEIVLPEGFRHEIVRVDSVGKHTSGLTEAEISDVIAIAGPALQRKGYSV